MKMCSYCKTKEVRVGRKFCCATCKDSMVEELYGNIVCDTCKGDIPYDTKVRYTNLYLNGKPPKMHSCSGVCNNNNPIRSSISSDTMSRTNRMKKNNPMYNKSSRDTDPFKGTIGGNGRGLTEQEAMLSNALQSAGIEHTTHIKVNEKKVTLLVINLI